MLQIKNKNIMLTCEDKGNEFIVVDLKRGTRWIIDEKTIVYGTEMYNDMYNGELKFNSLIPINAEIERSDSLVLTFKAGDAVVKTIYILKEDYIEVRIPVPEVVNFIGSVSMPGSFNPKGENLKVLLPIMQGMLWDGSGKPFENLRPESAHVGFTMPFIGYMSETGGLLFTSETYDDLWWWIGKEESGRYWASNIQISSIGTMRYERVGRIYLTDSDITKIAKAYRNKIIEQGRFKCWEEKIAERPALENLFGSLMCYIGYCQDDIDYVDNCKKLKDYGFDRALLYPGRFNIYSQGIHMGGKSTINLSEKEVDEIKTLGYGMAPWTWLNEALNDNEEQTQKMFMKNHRGEMVPNWAIDDQKWYWVCNSFIEEFQKNALKTDIADMTWDHFDVLSCAALRECYAEDHPSHLRRPMTRTESRDHLKKVFRAGQSKGMAISSEGFSDAFSNELDFGSVKAWPQYGYFPFWPIPLTMLIYHDSMIHSWWELHSYNVPWRSKTRWLENFEYGGGKPRLMAAMDALYGCPPDVFPFGAQYGYTGRGTETYIYKYRFEDPEVQVALKEALPVANLHRKIGKLEMINFRFLSDDGCVQETTFSDGTKIIANFGKDVYGNEKGIDHIVIDEVDSILPESWRIVEG